MRRGVLTAAGLAVVLMGVGCRPGSVTSPSATPEVFTCIDDGLRKAGTCSQADFEAQAKEQATFAEAKRIYEGVLAERNRVALVGGADEAGPTLKELSGDPMLGELVGFFQKQKAQGQRREGALMARDYAIERSRTVPDATFAIAFCEDGTNTRAWDSQGRELGAGRVSRSFVFFKPLDGKLKAFSWDNEVVTACGPR